MPTTSATTHKLADVRLAQQLLGLLPRIGPVWQAAVRDTNSGSALRVKGLGLLSRRGPPRARGPAPRCGITPPAVTRMIQSLVQATHGRRLVLVTVGIMLALFLAALDQTIVGTALPRIVAELNGLDYYAWVLTAYLVTSTIMTPISGKLGDLFGRKPLLLIGMIGFVLASALCAQARDMLEPVLFRSTQAPFPRVPFPPPFP